WFRNGFPNDAENDPRFGGSVLMSLTGGGLTVNGVLVSSSDRNAKSGFTAGNPQAILAKVAALPIRRWHFTNDVNTPHLGPVAQDFHAAFNVGEDDKHIATVDADGVALAAIQGLNQKVEEKDARIADLERRLETLERLVNVKAK
ncbi:MAG TPA: tail fiber domain-containing protein, partial [Candidatus Acidoferrum sp.]|nr:tail fiber domain-containing protein [Candidatus Acidoferrum sp.]